MVVSKGKVLSRALRPYPNFVSDQLLGLGIYSNYLDSTHLRVSESLVVLLDLGHGWSQASVSDETISDLQVSFRYFVTSRPASARTPG